MKFTRNILATAVATMLFSAGSSAALAAVDLSATTPAPALVAKELLSANTNIANTINVLNLQGKFGWGVAANNHLYIRIDLVNGKFKNALSAGDVTNSSASASFTSSVANGGAAASTSVIFDVSDTLVPIALTESFVLATKDLTIVDPTQSITVSVKFFTDSTLAATNGTALSTLTGTFVSPSAALTTTYTPDTSVALVAKDYKEFGASSHTPGVVPGAGTTALLGSVATVINGTVPLPVLNPATGAQVLASALATASNLVLTGQFGAAGSNASAVFASTATDCTVPTAAVLDSGKTTATFTGFAGNTLVPAKKYICFTTDGLTVIPAQTISGVLSFTGQVSPASIANASGTAGIITHDGTELQSPWFSTAGGYISRFVLVNSGTAAAPYTSRVITESGNVCTSGSASTGTIAAGQQLVIDASAICSSLSSLSRASVQFSVAAPNNTIQGVYNIVNQTTGSISVSNLVRPGTN